MGTTGTTPFAGGGGVYLETNTDTSLFASVFELNDAVTGPDCDGAGSSDGFNLFGTRDGCTVATVSSDRTKCDEGSFERKP